MDQRSHPTFELTRRRKLSTLRRPKLIARGAPAARVQRFVRWRLLSKKFLELFDVESSIARNAAHRESVYWIVARNRHNANTIRHDDVFTLAQDAKVGFLQRLYGIEMIDARNL